MTPLIERRQRVPHTAVAATVVRGLRMASCCDLPSQRQPEEAHNNAAAEATSSEGLSSPVTSCASRRMRCQVCPVKKDSKTTTVCCRCKNYVCRACSHVYCPTCSTELGMGQGGRAHVDPGRHAGVCREGDDDNDN